MTHHNQRNSPTQTTVADLAIRPFRDTSDYERIAYIFDACRDVDQLEWHATAEEIERYFTSDPYLEPAHDVHVAEVGDETVGFAVAFTSTDADGLHLHHNMWFVVPAWRGHDIGRTLLHLCEARAHERVTSELDDGTHYLQAWVNTEQHSKRALVQREGYKAVRNRFTMLRPLDEIPERPLPAGLEVRDVESTHHTRILDAYNEAFLDHWSYVPLTIEQHYAMFVDDPEADTGLWRIAWEGDEVAGVCLNVIYAEENAVFNRKRGWIHVIGVRRPWRTRGLATALLADSLRTFRARGMEEAALGVDSENLTGALRLYENVGFYVHRRNTLYRKLLL